FVLVGSDVVDRQDARRSERSQQIRDIGRVGGPIGVEEHEVPPRVGRGREGQRGILGSQLYLLVEARFTQVVVCERGAGRIVVDADYVPARRLGAVGEPDRRV